MDISLLSDEIKEAFETQKAMFQEMKNALLETNAALQASIREKDELIAGLREQIANLNKIIFSARSEKTVYVDPAQKELFPTESPENQQTVLAPNAQSIPVPAHERKPKRSRKEIYDSLPAEKEIITLPEDRRLDSNGQPMEAIGL